MTSIHVWNGGRCFELESEINRLAASASSLPPDAGWEKRVATLEYSLSADELLNAWKKAQASENSGSNCQDWIGFAWVEKKIAGILVARVVLDEIEIDYVATFPHVRRRGLARRLMDLVEAIAGTVGANRVVLEVASQNLAAQKLYAMRGFKKIGHRKWYYKDGDDALVLAKTFCSSR